MGIWPGNGDGESAKFWFACLTELKHRGIKDVFFMVCDGLKGIRWKPALNAFATTFADRMPAASTTQ